MHKFLLSMALCLAGLATGCGMAPRSSTPEPEPPTTIEDHMNVRVYRGTTEINLNAPDEAVDNIGECYAHPDDGWLCITVVEHDDGHKTYHIIVRYSILNGGDEPISLELQNAEECEVRIIGELESVPPGGALLITETKPITEAGGSWSFDVNLTGGDGTTTKWKITGTVPE